MKHLSINLLTAFFLLFFTHTLADQSQVVRMATTTSTENSGLFDVIQPVIEQTLNIEVHVIAVGTGKALELGRRGDVDVVLVHAKPAEQAFVDAGYGVARHEIMYNDFIIVGPTDDPAGIQGMHNADKALARIAVSASPFVSRGDDSGTHKKERRIWKQAGIIPNGSWYRQVGQGMGKTLQIAGEMQAYTLVDRGTWLAYRSNIPLELLVKDGEDLRNPYGIIAVNPERYPEIPYKYTERLIDWFKSKAAHTLISNYRINGEQLFYPVN